MVPMASPEEPRKQARKHANYHIAMVEEFIAPFDASIVVKKVNDQSGQSISKIQYYCIIVRKRLRESESHKRRQAKL